MLWAGVINDCDPRWYDWDTYWSLCNCSVFHHAPLTVSATSGSGSGGDNSGETTSASVMARPGPGPLGSGHVVFSNCDREGTH